MLQFVVRQHERSLTSPNSRSFIVNTSLLSKQCLCLYFSAAVV